MGVKYFDWPAPPDVVSIDDGKGHCWKGEELKGLAPKHNSRAEFSLLRKLLRSEEVARILNVAPSRLQCNVDSGAAMTLDSVDKFPNIWVYFIQNGRYMGDLDDLLRPLVEERIEPFARQRFGSHVLVCHCFLRRYIPEERRRLAAHFDHHAYITAVVGLNPEDFEGGLFLQGEARTDRYFIYLEKGDVVFHQYNLHHGVEVTTGSRYSLVFWLMDCWQSCIRGTVPWYQRSAEAGDSDAQHLWASCLAQGEHSGLSKPDLEAAIPWFEKSVAQENVEGMNVYAAILWEEQSVCDKQRALSLWKEASGLGYAKARGNLGGILCTGGDGFLQRDYAEGMRLLRSASEMEDYDSMMKLASHLRRSGNPEALIWMERCAEMGNPDACMMMAEVHLSGELGIISDPAAILKYTRWASNLGCQQAMVNLGTFYAGGDYGVEMDMRKAVDLWQKAAASGDADAQVNLALCHSRGEGGLACNPREASRLCDAAASQGQLLALQLQLDFQQAASAGGLQASSDFACTDEIDACAEQPATLQFQAGACVQLFGLHSEAGARLNGRTGRLRSFDSVKKKWFVILDGMQGDKLIRPQNILPLALEATAAWECVD